ncbi:MAG: FAD/NAD(P)-binding protein [Chitinophagales bacterium]|nr:FAD/NAD(P)-binding protein [Chitinophagales bacterium]
MNKTIGIIGAGLSGTLVAINLLRKSTADTTIVLIEKQPEYLFRGIAYQMHALHLPLNVPVKKMSLYGDDADHFQRWLQVNQEKYVEALPDIGPDAFVSRGVYGHYIEDTFHEALGHSEAKLKIVYGDVFALDAQGEGLTVRFADGKSVTVDKLVLATGNFASANVPLTDNSFYESDQYLASGWADEVPKKIDANDDVLVLGMGLTGVDILLTLKRMGHKGKIHLLSRNGLLPKSHDAVVDVPTPDSMAFGNTAASISSGLRKTIKEWSGKANWQSILDSVRPITIQLWQSMEVREKQLFLKYLRPQWDVHRHRIPKSSQAVIDQLLSENRLQLHAGRLRQFLAQDGKTTVSYLAKNGQGLQTFSVDKVINCTGPNTDYSKVPSPLVKQLLTDGYAQLDELKLGYVLDNNGALIDSQGVASQKIYTIGPPRKGSLWETIALREIRMQAEELPKVLLD